MVIEDTVELLQEFTLLLEMEGYKVYDFTDARDALDQIDEIKPDVVITDIVMPNMDGVTFIKRLREHGPYRNLPVIVCTADKSIVDSNSLEEYNVAAIVPKPCNFDHLIEEINKNIDD